MRIRGGQPIATRREAIKLLGGLVSYDQLRSAEQRGELSVSWRGPDRTVYYRVSDIELWHEKRRRKRRGPSSEGERQARLLERMREGRSDVDIAIELRERLEDVRVMRAAYENSDLLVTAAHVAELRRLARRLGFELGGGDELVELFSGLVKHAERCELDYPRRRA